MSDTYRNYFDIDPEYFPVVNEAIIQENPDLWKKFYPHESFVSLLKGTVSVLNRQQKLCLWVEGSYGTGKSHAVLTLKKLLDADAEDVRAYFDQYSLDKSLRDQFVQAKSGKKLLTVHRYGSSDIHGDQDLAFNVQDAIQCALQQAGLPYQGSALKDATVKWLSDPLNRNFFNDLMTGPYLDVFGGDTVETLIEKLNTFAGTALTKVMGNVTRVAHDRQINALSLSMDDVCAWIKDIIQQNDLKGIFFIWDEFTEYFTNNAHHLTGFQGLCQLAITEPFCLIPVTHETGAIFADTDPDYKKLNGRFINPHVRIWLPDNIAFQLMGAALKKTDDPVLAAEWDEAAQDLAGMTKDSRKLVQAAAKITDKEMLSILPIHPFAALLLKNIASVFDSDTRSMFDFIKNDNGEDIHGFQWFIDECGPMDENPLLTIDMLWDFFYEKGKDSLPKGVRGILDYYSQPQCKNLDSDQRRVLKTVLLMHAISQRVNNAVELFVPNIKNLEYAFEGTDMSAPVNCANQLEQEKVLFVKGKDSSSAQYMPYSVGVDIPDDELEKARQKVDDRSTFALATEQLVDSTRVVDAIELTGALKLRYRMEFCGESDFDTKVKKLHNDSDYASGKIMTLACFAKSEQEATLITKKINKALESKMYDIVFIDATATPFGALYSSYREASARNIYYTGKDGTQANQYSKDAKDELKKWKTKVLAGEFKVYTKEKPHGERANTLDALYTALQAINRKKYPDSLEATYTVIANMYLANSLKLGVECGAKQTTSGTFRNSNDATKLENALKGAWGVEQYWVKNPHLPISRIKAAVDKELKKGFDASGRTSIRSVYETLKAEPYGFMPCNLSAFILGFVLKEYADGSFSWSDDLTSTPLTYDKLKDMVAEVIQLEVIPNSKYREKYIGTMKEEVRAFNSLTSTAFGIAAELCTSVPDTRNLIRNQMKTLSFPIWTLKYVLDSQNLTTDSETLARLIDYYMGIANTANLQGNMSDSDIAMEIGKIALTTPSVTNDLKTLLTKEMCRSGMTVYLQTFEGGRLIDLVQEIGNNVNYVNAVQDKFDADAANWVWGMETAQAKIQEVILEYSIVVESNKIISKSLSYKATINEWINKCNNIHISYLSAKNYLDELGPLLLMLYDIKKTGKLSDGDRQRFLDLLQTNGQAFKTFYADQVPMFAKVCDSYLDNIDQDGVKEIFSKISSGTFTWEKSDYSKLVHDTVNAWWNDQKYIQLKKLWRERTGTDSPEQWSKQNSMPILAMVPDAEFSKAKKAFDTLNIKKPSAYYVDAAMEYLQGASFFAQLDDQAALDSAFASRVLKGYITLLTDVSIAKQKLAQKVTLVAPYDWLNHPEVEKKVRQLAQQEYDINGSDRAQQIIDGMDADEVKRWLKNLIADNMIVGMEIIKEN